MGHIKSFNSLISKGELKLAHDKLVISVNLKNGCTWKKWVAIWLNKPLLLARINTR
jgi:hypothetical protein